MSQMSHDDHLAWAKKRALQYVDAGELANAIASMGSDLEKHPDWAGGKVVAFMVTEAVLFEIQKGPAAVRRWIEGFN